MHRLAILQWLVLCFTIQYKFYGRLPIGAFQRQWKKKNYLQW